MNINIQNVKYAKSLVVRQIQGKSTTILFFQKANKVVTIVIDRVEEINSFSAREVVPLSPRKSLEMVSSSLDPLAWLL